MGSGECEVDRGQLAVGSGQWAVRSGKWIVGIRNSVSGSNDRSCNQ